MIDRLQEVLPHLQYFPPEMPEEIASHIEALEHKVPFVLYYLNISMQMAMLNMLT